MKFFTAFQMFPKYNFSVDHPFGVRDNSGVFKFAGNPEYDFDDVEPVYLIDSQGNPLDPEISMPVFPDPTFGGVLPGMTMLRIFELSQME
ncbi:MAG TPA: hypothetical protein ENH82_19450 [bacterium]|nr:hypothetical protein [bacterium]